MFRIVRTTTLAGLSADAAQARAEVLALAGKLAEARREAEGLQDSPPHGGPGNEQAPAVECPAGPCSWPCPSVAVGKCWRSAGAFVDVHPE
jgi:hypothetical protein